MARFPGISPSPQPPPARGGGEANLSSPWQEAAGSPQHRVLVWQWGRFGAGPRIAVLLAEGLQSLPDVAVSLSLSNQAEILHGPTPPDCALPVDTYRGVPGFLGRVLTAPILLPRLIRRLRDLAPDVAICAMPGPLDWLMARALRWAGVPFIVLIHDADAHPGDGFPGQMWLQRRLCHATSLALQYHQALPIGGCFGAVSASLAQL